MNSEAQKLQTDSADSTRELAVRLASGLVPGDVVALSGELGAGKTVFVQGIAQGLGVEEEFLVTSPTFVILHEYPGRMPLYHFDFYRLKSRQEAEGVGYEDYFEAEGVCAVEWAQRFPEIFSARTLWVRMEIKSETKRLIELIPGPDMKDPSRIEKAVLDRNTEVV
ncbi:MAG: tRNA (adenosine(37)-N6)-threonylcarbamoyltransferase complex ATPase subunit type 1 TsaE [bacterium]